MADKSEKTVLRNEYRPPDWFASETNIEFDLLPESTRVKTEILFRRNREIADPKSLHLDGKELNLLWASINGVNLDDEITKDAENGLTVPSELLPKNEFKWRAETEINPQQNTSLDGLYMSNGMYCTQCEPEGFRRICHFQDRPDVLSKFTVRINSELPVLLSNGNLLENGDGFAVWSDPWPKPSYLFALVAGDLVAVQDNFKTMGGDNVQLRIFVRSGDERKCDYAMDSLKRAMRWDEDNYGRQYDLDQFNIVAVDDFNMGAMENKGLNIFNSKLVLASPETATDVDYERIESVIAHEYFHNWTGNRITCRDWFQLSLKEGLTVFRDRQFSSDQRSADVVRIKDVRNLRANQFKEDAGPLAHPVRPESYRKISNFYTNTIYEKGAELIAVLNQLVGEESFRTAMDLYFERHDGQACTIEDFVKVFEDTTKSDLSQFRLWYSQSGTPHVSFFPEYSGSELRLTIRQETQPTLDQPEKQPLPIPICTALLDDEGNELVSPRVLLLNKWQETFRFEKLPSCPRVSILRGFSAPVILKTTPTDEDALFMLRYDTDNFKRWDASQQLTLKLLCDMVVEQSEPDENIIHALKSLAFDQSVDPAFRALMLQLPPEIEVRQQLADIGHILDPVNFYEVCHEFGNALASAMSDDLVSQFRRLSVGRPYTTDSKSAGPRALRLGLLRLLSKVDTGKEAENLFQSAGNMTEKLGALRALLSIQRGQEQLDEFYDEWSQDRLVLDKWFAIQIVEAPPSHAVELTRQLTRHRDFEWKNPNRFYSVVASFAFANNAGFHSPDGGGYKLLADWIIKVDEVNSQVAARQCTAFESRMMYDKPRQSLMLEEMRRIRRTKKLSSDSAEMLDRLMSAI